MRFFSRHLPIVILPKLIKGRVRTQLYALGLGIGTQNQKQPWLEVFFAQPLLQPPKAIVEALGNLLGYNGGNVAIEIAAAKAAQLLFRILRVPLSGCEPQPVLRKDTPSAE